MKNNVRPFLSLLLASLGLATAGRAQSVGIGTTTPETSAVLDVRSTSQGLLPPRLTAAQRQAIASPAQGLLVFQTDGSQGLYYYSGVAWLNLANGRVPDANGSTTPANGGAVSTAVSPSASSNFLSPAGVAVGPDGTVYVTSVGDDVLFQVDNSSAAVNRVAGTGQVGYVDGQAVNARFNNPTGVAVGPDGTVYVADAGNNCIRQVSRDGSLVSTLTGSVTDGTADGTGPAARFRNPTGMAVDVAGTLYVADQGSNRIRKITPAGVVTTLAGSGSAGFTDGQGVAAEFASPTGVAVSAGGTVYVADTGNNCIRQISSAGVVTTLAGSVARTAGSTNGTGPAARFNRPTGITIDAGGVLYVADNGNNRVRQVTSTGVVTTLAGSGTTGATDGPGATARFNGPFGVAVDASGTVYVTDQNSNSLRAIK
jgi:serine/threonine-protein kinase